MPNGTAPVNHTMAWAVGELIGSALLNEQNEALLDIAGEMLADGLLGVPSFNGTGSPLTVTAGPGIAQATVGGLGQECVLGYRVCNEIPATILQFSGNATGGPRTDLIVGQPIESQGYEFTTPFRNTDRSVNPAGDAYKNIQGANFKIIKGPNAVPPAGWYPVATVIVLSGTRVLAGNITMVLPTFSSIVNGMVTAQIAAAIAAIPAVNAPGIESTTGTMTVSFDGTNYHVDNPGIYSLNGEVGNVVIEDPTNSLTIGTPSAGIVTIENPGILSLAGEVGAVLLESTDGSIAITALAGVINLSNAGVQSIAGQTGNITLDSPDNSIGFSIGNSVIEVYNNGVTSIAGLAGAVGVTSAGSIIITDVGNNVNIEVGGILSLDGQHGNVVLASPLGTIAFGTSGASEITLDVANTQSAIGACIAASHVFTAVALPMSLSLGAALPTGTWFIEAFCIGLDFSGAGSGQNATLTGSGASWGGNSYIQQPAYTRTLMIVGTAVGGQTPSVTVTGNGGVELIPNSTAGYLTIKAIRIA